MEWERKSEGLFEREWKTIDLPFIIPNFHSFVFIGSFKIKPLEIYINPFCTQISICLVQQIFSRERVIKNKASLRLIEKKQILQYSKYFKTVWCLSLWHTVCARGTSDAGKGSLILYRYTPKWTMAGTIQFVNVLLNFPLFYLKYPCDKKLSLTLWWEIFFPTVIFLGNKN